MKNMLLIVGLGNPGAAYKSTYHNCGFLTLEKLAQKFDAGFNKNECFAQTAHVFAAGGKAVLAKPQTFMNLSGKSVFALAQKYKLGREDIVIVYDDVDLPIGTLRLRNEGRAGTHNGMKDIVERIGTSEFKRVRIGIGSAQEPAMQLSDFVTSKINEENAAVLSKTFDTAAEALFRFCHGEDFAVLMREYN